MQKERECNHGGSNNVNSKNGIKGGNRPCVVPCQVFSGGCAYAIGWLCT